MRRHARLQTRLKLSQAFKDAAADEHMRAERNDQEAKMLLWKAAKMAKRLQNNKLSLVSIDAYPR